MKPTLKKSDRICNKKVLHIHFHPLKHNDLVSHEIPIISIEYLPMCSITFDDHTWLYGEQVLEMMKYAEVDAKVEYLGKKMLKAIDPFSVTYPQNNYKTIK
jgi:hypothetical protein